MGQRISPELFFSKGLKQNWQTPTASFICFIFISESEERYAPRNSSHNVIGVINISESSETLLTLEIISLFPLK